MIYSYLHTCRLPMIKSQHTNPTSYPLTHPGAHFIQYSPSNSCTRSILYRIAISTHASSALICPEQSPSSCVVFMAPVKGGGSPLPTCPINNSQLTGRIGAWEGDRGQSLWPEACPPWKHTLTKARDLSYSPPPQPHPLDTTCPVQQCSAQNPHAKETASYSPVSSISLLKIEPPLRCFVPPLDVQSVRDEATKTVDVPQNVELHMLCASNLGYYL